MHLPICYVRPEMRVLHSSSSLAPFVGLSGISNPVEAAAFRPPKQPPSTRALALGSYYRDPAANSASITFIKISLMRSGYASLFDLSHSTTFGSRRTLTGTSR